MSSTRPWLLGPSSEPERKTAGASKVDQENIWNLAQEGMNAEEISDKLLIEIEVVKSFMDQGPEERDRNEEIASYHREALRQINRQRDIMGLPRFEAKEPKSDD